MPTTIGKTAGPICLARHRRQPRAAIGGQRAEGDEERARHAVGKLHDAALYSQYATMSSTEGSSRKRIQPRAVAVLTGPACAGMPNCGDAPGMTSRCGGGSPGRSASRGSQALARPAAFMATPIASSPSSMKLAKPGASAQLHAEAAVGHEVAVLLGLVDLLQRGGELRRRYRPAGPSGRRSRARRRSCSRCPSLP